MTMNRRGMLQSLAGVLAVSFSASPASAQAYPSGPVRLLVGFPAGGPVDIAGRMIASWLTQRLGQPFDVHNRPGESGNLATRNVVHAHPDGRTLLVCGPVNTINTTLFRNLDFNFERDLVPVGTLFEVPLVIHVRPSLPVGDLAEFIAYARANPTRLKVAFAGAGTPQHVAIELFKQMADVKMASVPYLGSAPALSAVMAGEADAMFDPLPSSMAPIRAGRLRALAVTSPGRSQFLPDIPAASEIVPDYEAGSWFGLCAPANTAMEIVQQLNREVGAALSDQTILARIADIGGVPRQRSVAETATFFAAETTRYAAIVRSAGLSMN